MGVQVALPSGLRNISLDDKALSLSLEYLYKKTSSELLQFNDRNLVDRVGTMVDGILYCRSRLTEDQSLRIVGGLENVIDLAMGVDFTPYKLGMIIVLICKKGCKFIRS